jgi:hypothetical protein
LHTSATLGANEIQSNKLNIAAVNNAAIVDTETTDKMFVVNWTPTAASINDAAIVVRYVDASNFIACGFTARATVNNSYILRTVAGSGSYNPIVSKSYTLGNTYQIFGGNIGDTIVCGVDGVIGATTSMSDFSSNTKGGYGSIGSNTLQVFDLGYTHTTYPGLLPSGRLPDDPDGMLNGMNIGAGSGFWMAPGDVPTTICSASSFYAGGSIYCNPVAGTHDVDFVLYNSTPNAISTVNVQVTKSGAGAVAPVLGAIPAEVCTINVDCGARSLVQYETTAAEPAGTWTDDGNGAPGRLLSPSGTITGACATPGVFTREVTDTNATGSDDATISETCSADQIPDALSGPLDVVGADVDTLYTVGTTASTGSCWSITGISFTTSFTFSRSDTAEYQKNGGAWVSTGSGTVENNDVICPRETSASGDNEARSATLNVNGVADTWTIVTAPDTNADDLTFPSVQSATAASTAQSVCQTVSGLGDGVSIAASVDIGTWTKTCAGGTGYGAGAGTITNGDSIGLRQTFPAAGIAQTQQFAYGDKTASFVAETLLGTPPVCSLDIETQFKVVGDALNLDIGVGCTGVDSWSYSEAELPNGASGSGSVISATSLTGNAGAREDVTTIAQAINQFGTLNRAVVFHIAPAGIVSECSQRKYGSVGHTITSSVTKCPLSP